MKKKGFKKLLCAGLVLTMLLGLTACGSKDPNGAGNAGIGSNGKDDEKSYANAALAKEYVFSEQPIDMPDMGDSMGLRMMNRVDDTVYVVYEVYHWDDVTYQQSQNMKLMTMNLDGSNIRVMDLQMSIDDAAEGSAEAGSAGDSGTEGEASENDVNHATDSENATTEVPAEPAVDSDIAVDDMVVTEGYFYEYTGINQMTISSDGKLYGVKNYYLEDYRDQANPITENDSYVCCWNLDGTMLWESKMEPLQTEESYSYVQGLVAMNDGVQLILSGEKMELMPVAADGSMGERKDLPAEAETLNSSYGTFAQEDGAITYIYWDMNGESKMWLGSFDFNTMTAGEPQLLPESLYMTGFNALASGGDMADIIYSSDQGVFGINTGDTEAKQLMSFVNSDIYTSSMNNMLVLNENQLLGFYYDNGDGMMKGGIFTKVNPEDIKDKAVIVLAANWLDYDLKGRVVDFNKSNSDYRIVVKEYSQYSTMDDYMAGYTQLNNDIIAGGMPDILVADNNMPVESYIAKGWIADIESLIAADEELSQKEFMTNVFDAYKVNGKLYYVIPSFNVRTIIGKSSKVGDRSTWTVQDMMALSATLPEGTQIFGEMTRESFMYQMMQYCGRDFVDVSTGKCAFDSENFISMLEYAKTLPEQLGEDYYDEDFWMTYESQYREDRTILMNTYISRVRDMNLYINGYFGEEISYVGFPTDSGQGSVVQASNKYVLSARSKNLDGAWQFIRYYLTDEYQKELQYDLPIDKAVFKAQAQDAMNPPYYLDENGEKVEYEDTFYMNGESFPLPNMTQAQVDKLIAVVEGINKCSYYNEDVQNIVLEESAAFFEGQKTAADVAGIIQSRVQIYVNENM